MPQVTSSRQRKEKGPTSHAGGVVYRAANRRVEYLLVRPKRSQDEWVLPKGHIESGESCEQAAIREVREETGVVARIIAPLRTTEFVTNGKLVRIKFFLMQFVAQRSASETREESGWGNRLPRRS
jgi:ADP-ribose pyrophosphatase YjhB (NUDIX family)